MNVKKLYRYLLFSGLMTQAFIPIGSLALKVPNGQMMLFGVSWHPLGIYSVFASFISGNLRFFDGDSVISRSNDGNPVDPTVSAVGAFLKDNVHYLFKIMGPGTACVLGANEYNWICNDVVSKFMQKERMVMQPCSVVKDIFSCINGKFDANLDQSGIHKYLGERNKYVLDCFRDAMNDFVGWLNGPENEDRQAMDFNTLCFEIRKSFIWWLCMVANTAKTYPGVDAYKVSNDSIISSNWDKDKIADYAAIAEFWSDTDNVAICEFWNATMAWFLCVFYERGVWSANGESLIKFAIAELQWLVECVGLFLENDRPSDDAINNVTTQGCMVQLKNYCYLLYHYKKKMYDVLESSTIYTDNDDSLRQIKASMDNLCKQWDGRKLADIMGKESNKYQSWLNFLGDKGRNNALNAETDLNNLRNFLHIKYESIGHSKIDSAEEEKLNLVARYIDSMQRVLCHIRNYSLWIKDNLETYCKQYEAESAHNAATSPQSTPEKQDQHKPDAVISSLPHQKQYQPKQKQNHTQPGQKGQPVSNIVISSLPQQKHVQQQSSAPSSLGNGKSDANLTATGVGQNANNLPQNKLIAAQVSHSMPLGNVVLPVQNYSYNYLSKKSGAGSSLYNTYTPSKGKTFMSKTLLRKGKMRSNLNKTGRLNKSFGQGKHPKSRENSNDNKKRKHREVAN
jgi:hypothetical protein